MQPNDQQGYYQPDQPQPAEPVGQPNPVVEPADTQVASNDLDSEAPYAPEQLASNMDDDESEPIEAPVSWTAHEYIHQEKGALWFLAFAVTIAALVAVAIFLMNSPSFAVLLGVIAVVVIVYSRRPPRELTYSITNDGMYIDDKLHKFETFKSFGVIHDGAEFSVMLIPVQRFQPGITVYFPEESGEEIVDMLGSRLPMKDLKLDAVDRLVRMLRL